MSFRPKIKSKIIAVLFAILPAFVVGSLVLGANVYYDLDSNTVKTNEKTGAFEPVKIKGLEHGDSGLEKIQSYSSDQNISDSKMINLPEKSSGESNCFNRLFNDEDKFSRVGGNTLNKIIPEYLEGGNLKGLEKSRSCVKIILSSLLAMEAISKSLLPFGANLTSCPDSLNRFDNLNLTFSSAKNFIELFSQTSNTSFLAYGSGEPKSGHNMFSVEGGVVFQDFFNSFSGGKHFQNQINHNSGAFESGLAMADSWVGSDIFADNNFSSHIGDSDIELDNYQYSRDSGDLSNDLTRNLLNTANRRI